MYCAYSYNAGLTAANLLSDIVKLLTGTTNVNDLSADCDKTRTDIKSVEPAGWTVYDNDAVAMIANNKVCLRAPVYDNPNLYKYVVIETNTATAVGYLYNTVYEAWSTVTHTGTNQSSNSATQNYATRFDKALKGRIDMRVTARCIIFSAISPNRYLSANNTLSGVLEFTRGADWDTIANAYPNFGYVQLAGSTQLALYAPRSVSSIEQTDGTTTEGGILSYISPGDSSNNQSVNPSAPTRIETSTADKMLAIPLWIIGFNSFNTGRAGGGELSSLNGIYMTITKCLVNSKLIDPNGQAYVVWQGASSLSSYKYAVKYA